MSEMVLEQIAMANAFLGVDIMIGLVGVISLVAGGFLVKGLRKVWKQNYFRKGDVVLYKQDGDLLVAEVIRLKKKHLVIELLDDSTDVIPVKDVIARVSGKKTADLYWGITLVGEPGEEEEDESTKETKAFLEGYEVGYSFRELDDSFDVATQVDNAYDQGFFAALKRVTDVACPQCKQMHEEDIQTVYDTWQNACEFCCQNDAQMKDKQEQLIKELRTELRYYKDKEMDRLMAAVCKALDHFMPPADKVVNLYSEKIAKVTLTPEDVEDLTADMLFGETEVDPTGDFVPGGCYQTEDGEIYYCVTPFGFGYSNNDCPFHLIDLKPLKSFTSIPAQSFYYEVGSKWEKFFEELLEDLPGFKGSFKIIDSGLTEENKFQVVISYENYGAVLTLNYQPSIPLEDAL